MSGAEKSPLAAVKPEKSKWLSSLVWIVVLWLFVRLIAEMDGISWERVIWKAALVFGALPATASLLAAVSCPVGQAQRAYRWLALAIVLFSFFGFVIFSLGIAESIVESFLLPIQIFVIFAVVSGRVILWLKFGSAMSNPWRLIK